MSASPPPPPPAAKASLLPRLNQLMKARHTAATEEYAAMPSPMPPRRCVCVWVGVAVEVRAACAERRAQRYHARRRMRGGRQRCPNAARLRVLFHGFRHSARLGGGGASGS